MASKFSGYKVQKTISIRSISSIHYFEFDDKFVDHMESHEEWEMVYIDRGKCHIIADGESFLLSQGEMYFHKPQEEHMLQIIEGVPSNIFIITFHCNSAAMRYFEKRKLEADVSTKQHIATIIHEASNTYYLPFNNPAMSGLKYKSGKILWAGDQTVLMRLELMLIELIRLDESFAERPRAFLKKEIIEDDLCFKIVEYMEAHLYEKLSMNELSRNLSFSKSYISKRFASTCGYSIVDYFNTMKINEAKRLIRETNKNFVEIAELLMLSNSHYFSTLFKKYSGMTPTQYKKSCMKK